MRLALTCRYLPASASQVLQVKAWITNISHLFIFKRSKYYQIFAKTVAKWNLMLSLSVYSLLLKKKKKRLMDPRGKSFSTDGYSCQERAAQGSAFLFIFLETGCKHAAQAGQLSTLLASTSQALWQRYDASLCHVTFKWLFQNCLLLITLLDKIVLNFPFIFLQTRIKHNVPIM